MHLPLLQLPDEHCWLVEHAAPFVICGWHLFEFVSQ
jgi:hypothetical protein